MSWQILRMGLALALSLPLHAGRISISELNSSARIGDTVSLKGTVTSVGKYFVVLHDGTGHTTAYDDVRIQIANTGDVLQVTAKVEACPTGKRIRLQSHDVVGFDPVLAAPIPVSPASLILRKDLGGRALALTGRVRDAFRDELDPLWVYFVLEEDVTRAVAALYDPQQAIDIPDAFIDSIVTVVGSHYAPYINGQRYLAASISSLDPRTLTVVKAAPADPYGDTPPLQEDAASINEAIQNGSRHRLSGTVLATWEGHAFFLKTPAGNRFRVRLNRRAQLPSPGTSVTVVGFARKHPFFINLVNALCRTDSTLAQQEENPVRKDARDLLFDREGRQHLNFNMDGRLVTVRGIVSERTHISQDRMRLFLIWNGTTFESEINSGSVPEIGASVDVTGICRFLEEDGSDANGIVRFNRFSVLARTPEDLVTIKNPPWWTPVKAIVAVSVLLILILIVLVRNFLLEKLIVRKSRELARESLAHAKAELRVDERMSLAVELHDSIAQNLTGVSMQMESIDEAHRTNSPQLGHLILTARRTLNACCNELRNCLWDLRNEAFDDIDTTKSVRKALEPHLAGAVADVAIDLPRDRLSDSTFHTILCIVRELTVNAIRHGHATRVVIRGHLGKNHLQFSVEDNGCGFDPANHPGAKDGHFGLQGVEERLARLGGSLSLDSKPGHGAHITATIEI